MDPVAIIDIIAWKIPYMIGHFFKLLVFIAYMLQINYALTGLSVIFMVVFRFGVLRPVDKKFEVKSPKGTSNSLKVLTKMEQKVKMMLNQTQSESLTMISSVKVGREDQSIPVPAVQQGGAAPRGAGGGTQPDEELDAQEKFLQVYF